VVTALSSDGADAGRAAGDHRDAVGAPCRHRTISAIA
jgi:hypothetical protein